MPKLPNRRHESFAKNVVSQDFNATKAYQATYPKASYATAMSNASDLLRNTKVKERVDEIAERKGLTVEFEIDNLIAKHKAQRPIIINGQIVEYPDHPTQLEAIKTGLKLHGFLNSAHQSINVDARSVNISLDAGDVKRLEDVAHMMRDIRKGLAKSERGGTWGGGEGETTSP